MQIEYILDNFDGSPPKPSSYVINRLVDLVCAACRKAINETIPPTRLYIPKSVSPKAWRTKREVYNDTNITMTVRIYSNIVFLAILLLSAFIDIVIYTRRSNLYSTGLHSLVRNSCRRDSCKNNIRFIKKIEATIAKAHTLA